MGKDDRVGSRKQPRPPPPALIPQRSGQRQKGENVAARQCLVPSREQACPSCRRGDAPAEKRARDGGRHAAAPGLATVRPRSALQLTRTPTTGRLISSRKHFGVTDSVTNPVWFPRRQCWEQGQNPRPPPPPPVSRLLGGECQASDMQMSVGILCSQQKCTLFLLN